MIINFSSKIAEDIYHGLNTRHSRKLPRSLHGKAHRLLDQLNVITQIETLKIPPSNQLEKLKGNLKNYWSIRINQQWRIIFMWENNHIYDVDIVDYH